MYSTNDSMIILSNILKTLNVSVNEHVKSKLGLIQTCKQYTFEISQPNQEPFCLQQKDDNILCPFCPKKDMEHYIFFIQLILHLSFQHREYDVSFQIEQKRLQRFGEIKQNSLLIRVRSKTDYNQLSCSDDQIYKKQLNQEFSKQFQDMHKINKQFAENIFLKSFEIQKRKKTSMPGDKKKRNGHFLIDDSRSKNQIFNMTKQQIKKVLENRTFYHSMNQFNEVESDSLFSESEDGISDTIIRLREDQAIDEFEDIDSNDKQFFKLWNNFGKDFKYERIQKQQIAFVKEDYKELNLKFLRLLKEQGIAEKLRHCFIMHLMNMLTYNLLNADEIFDLLLELNSK